MLRQEITQTAIPVAQSLADKNIQLSASPNTILSQLTSLSYPIFELQDSNLSFDNIAAIIEDSTRGSIDENSQHCLELDAIVEKLSECVNQHNSFARNVVKPLVMDFGAALEEYRNINQLKPPSSDFNIEVLDIPMIVTDDSFLDNLKIYVGKTPLRPDVKFNLDNRSRAELIELLRTGHERTDKLIVNWLVNTDDDFLTDAWINFFTSDTPSKYITFDYFELTNGFNKINYGLFFYLAARKLYNEIDDSASMDLKAYKNICAQYRDYGGCLIMDGLKRIDLFNKTKLIVVESFPKQKYMSVNGRVFREWQNEGNEVEILLGLLISGDSVYSKPLIDNKAKDYRREWDSYCTFYKANSSNKEFEYFKEFALTKFTELLKEQDPIEKEYHQKNTLAIESILKLAKNKINSLKKSYMDEPYDLALHLIGECRFYYTASFGILHDINEAYKVNPDIDVREAALLADIYYLADYLSDQISVSS